MNYSNESLRENITTLLSLYEVYLHNQNKSHRNNFNIECEGIFCDLLNKLYNWNLVNLNSGGYNYPAIDLGDKLQGVCIQVTSETSSNKIKETIEKFEANDLKDLYPRIFILILGQKKQYRLKLPAYVKIIDLGDIISQLSFSNDNAYLHSIQELLNNKFIQYNIPGAPTSFFTAPTPILVPAKNFGSYTQYLSDLKLNEEEIGTCINDIIYFTNKLLRLHINTRKLILFGIQNRIYHSEWYHDWNSYIHFNLKSMLLHIDNTILNYSISELDSLKHISGLDDAESICNFYFLDEGENYCILNEVVKFCEKTNRSIDQLLINLDLTIFD